MRFILVTFIKKCKIPGKKKCRNNRVLFMLLECILNSEPGAVSFVGLF